MPRFIEVIFRHEFWRMAILAGILSSISCGVIGSYVVTRRITYLAGAIAHCVLGGIGAAIYFNTVHGWTFLTPLAGAGISAVLAALLIGLVSIHAREREDTVIGAVWAVGMALGVLFMYRTPAYNRDVMSYLFGNINMLTWEHIGLLGGLDLLILALTIIFFKPLLAVCFDQEFARLRGLRVDFYYLLLLVMTSLTVVFLVTMVGLILVIALLTLPVAVAGNFAKSLKQLMVFSTLLAMLLTVTGLSVSMEMDLPSGATIIVLAGGVYLLSLVFSGVFRRRRA